MDIPVILHIPHASTLIPDEYLSSYAISPVELEAENLRLADLYTDELYQLDGAMRAVFPVSRFFVDAERFSEDAQETMAERGMGVLYTSTTHLSPLRLTIDPHERERILNEYYWPHHHALNAVAAQMLDRFGKCLIVDCHSYPSQALPYELDESRERPEIGIGTDSFHTPDLLVHAAIEGFSGLGYQTGLNTPFTGSLVPSAFYRKDTRLMSFMIEIRKDLYMNETSGEKLAGFEKLKCDIRSVIAQTIKIVL